MNGMALQGIFLREEKDERELAHNKNCLSKAGSMNVIKYTHIYTIFSTQIFKFYKLV